MNKKNISIQTNLNSIEIQKVFNKIISDKIGFFSSIFNKKYKGLLTDSNFKFNTIDEPPIELIGTIKDYRLDFLVKWDSLKQGYRSIGYVLGYTAVGVAIMLLINGYPYKVWTYIVSLIILPIPYILTKVYLFLNYNEPDPKFIIEKIKKLVDGEIIYDSSNDC